jgi:hypothetical protein
LDENKKMPIQVYLDSSDYSILSDPRKNDEKLIKIKNELISLVNQGLIEIRFSFVHVLEMAHVGIENRELSLCRFALMKELCGTKTLKSIPDMENTEIIGSVQNGIFSPHIKHIANDRGEWFPDFTDQINNIQQTIIDNIFDGFRKQKIPRKQRQILRKKIIRKGHLADAFFEFLPQNRSELLKSIECDFPLTKKFWQEDLILQFLKKKISKTELLNEFKAGFFDPETLIGWYIDRSNNSLSLPLFFRNWGQNDLTKVQDLIEQCKKLFDFGIKIGKSEKEASNDIKKLIKHLEKTGKFNRDIYLKKIWESRQKKLLKSGLTKKQWAEKIKSSKLGRTPSIDIYMQSLMKYVINSVSNVKSGRKLLNSDHPDLLHARYLPYVDIFRADKYMGNLLKPLAKPYNTQVVTYFPDIIKIIINSILTENP